MVEDTPSWNKNALDESETSLSNVAKVIKVLVEFLRKEAQLL